MRRIAAAFNAGVRCVIEHAYAAADAIASLPNYKEGRQGFARAALFGLAEAEEDLILSETVAHQAPVHAAGGGEDHCGPSGCTELSDGRNGGLGGV